MNKYQTVPRKIIYSLMFLVFIGCATSTEKGSVGIDRSQLLLVPSEQIISSSAQAYEQTKKEAQDKGILDRDPAMLQRLQMIVKKLIPQTSIFRKDAGQWQWEVHLISSKEINAYCMPGGKIIFYTGLIETLKLNDAQIAAVMGHEIAHALREHGRERMSEEILKQVGLMALAASGKIDQKTAMALNAVSTVMISLPHGRGQESEADEIGTELMARAGYNPHEALELWKKMGEQSGGSKPPEILSTHPSDATRLRNIQSLLPKVMPLYENSNKG